MEYDGANRLTSYNGEKVEYDAKGNMTYGPVDGRMPSVSSTRILKKFKTTLQESAGKFVSKISGAFSSPSSLKIILSGICVALSLISDKLSIIFSLIVCGYIINGFQQNIILFYVRQRNL